MPRLHALPRFGTFALAVLLSFGTLLSVAPAYAQETPTVDTPASEQVAVQVVDEVSPAVVTVFNLATAPMLLGQSEGQTEPQPQGVGTGFIIDEEGYIVTNWHVVDGGDMFSVSLSDGTEIDAELIGIDAANDLAVVKIDPAAVPAVVPLADSDQIQVGESVLAIGSPLGAFSNTVTGGIVSGVGRNQLQSETSNVCQVYGDLIQHDAAINPGNSGGPLFNMSGEVIGVNTLGITTTSTPTSTGQVAQAIQGIFFAVPSNTVQDTVEQLIETGEITRAYVGVTYLDLNPLIAAQNNLPVDTGAIVLEVAPNSPAAEAGLAQYDIITAVDGQELSNEQSFGDVMPDYQPGDQVTFTVLRGGEAIEAGLTLGEFTPDFSQCSLQQEPLS